LQDHARDTVSGRSSVVESVARHQLLSEADTNLSISCVSSPVSSHVAVSIHCVNAVISPPDILVGALSFTAILSIN